MRKISQEIELLKHNFKLIIRNKIIITSWIVSIIILLSTLSYLILNIKPTEFEIPIRYSSYSKTIGHWYKLYYMPLLGTIIFFINSIIATKYYNSEQFISYTLAVLSALISLLLLIQTSLFVYLV
ncbi:TPA: hypothetical protein DDW69_04235 [candidate division CPR2 bacterium]|nr:MAG: hypothetical protein UT60_C0029G0006 [candidate division CPR2 bacterium GW2011_GWD2_39_7]OGB72146.1 MAG: hypothetical protein A2Y26_04920 [candidate division CPR2 bacterium GWD2_39_7]HBG82013.1 hypothetical protein [candidate division CPR2 bacterium]